MVYLEYGPTVQNITVEEPSNNTVEVSRLLPGTRYRIHMAGINTRGIGAFSIFVYNTTYSGNKLTSLTEYLFQGIYSILVPYTTSNNASEISLAPGDDVYLICEFSGLPEPSVTWQQDGRVLTEDDDDNALLETSGNISELTVFDELGISSGLYQCIATNIVGNASTMFQITCKILLLVIKSVSERTKLTIN